MQACRRSVRGVLSLGSGARRAGRRLLFKFLVPRKEPHGLKGAAAGLSLTLTFHRERDCCPPQAPLRASQSQPQYQTQHLHEAGGLARGHPPNTLRELGPVSIDGSPHLLG